MAIKKEVGCYERVPGDDAVVNTMTIIEGEENWSARYYWIEVFVDEAQYRGNEVTVLFSQEGS